MQLLSKELTYNALLKNAQLFFNFNRELDWTANPNRGFNDERARWNDRRDLHVLFLADGNVQPDNSYN